MPFNLIDTDCSPLVIDYEYEIRNKDLLAEYVGQLLLGYYNHILNVINSLSSNSANVPNRVIDVAIQKLNTREIEKRDGWLFQMISWLALAHRNIGLQYHTQHPHFAPAQHGIDGLSIILKADNTIERIVITEDKCTTNPRDKIREEVLPEFKNFEAGMKDSALVGILASLLNNIDAGKVFQSVQNDIYNNKFRVYRIGITRDADHNSEVGRNRLFKDYEIAVTGDNCNRRSGATIHLDNLRNWMQEFSNSVITYLESKKS